MTQSMPGMSSLGNAMPQSTTMMLSPYSKAVMFMPICSRPPRGMIFTVADASVLIFLDFPSFAGFSTEAISDFSSFAFFSFGSFFAGLAALISSRISALICFQSAFSGFASLICFFSVFAVFLCFGSCFFCFGSCLVRSDSVLEIFAVLVRFVSFFPDCPSFFAAYVFSSV